MNSFLFTLLCLCSAFWESLLSRAENMSYVNMWLHLFHDLHLRNFSSQLKQTCGRYFLLVLFVLRTLFLLFHQAPTEALIISWSHTATRKLQATQATKRHRLDRTQPFKLITCTALLTDMYNMLLC